MKKVDIKYNPYLVKTEISIDGKIPQSDSSLYIPNDKRLQEWIEDFPSLLKNETGDCNFDVTFTGISQNFEDVQTAFMSNTEIEAKLNHNKTKDLADVEREIKSIFDEIQNGPVEELKHEDIVAAFEKANNSSFDVNVVATMSSGKSTLINALLAKRLMPAKNEATTATIVKINDNDVKDVFNAVAYNEDGEVVKGLDNVSLKDISELNNNNDVTLVEIDGDIPFVDVDSTGMKLTLVDTPGPNNSRTKDHKEMTYKMLQNSDKSLVLFVMNSTQSGTEDEKTLLDYVCKIMREGGKQGRERFIFAINKLDAMNPDEEADGPDCIDKQLKDIKKNLEDRGIINPNIFPVSALPALQKRDKTYKMPLDFGKFKDMSKYYNCLHLEEYYDYNNLTQSAKLEIETEKIKSAGDDDKMTEIHTGMLSIESAIRLYINKYARTIKIKDLVLSFNKKLNDLNVQANLEKAISEDKNKKQEFDAQITELEQRLAKAQEAGVFNKKIESINIMDMAEEQIDSVFEATYSEITNYQTNFVGAVKVPKEKAKVECAKLEEKCNNAGLQLKVKLENLIEEIYKNTLKSVLNEYEQYLSEMQIDRPDLSFNALNIVSSNLQNIAEVFNRNIETYDETETRTVTKQRFVKGNRAKRGGWGALFGGAVGFLLGGPLGAAAGAAIGGGTGAGTGSGDHWEDYQTTETYTNKVDYVDMSKVVKAYQPKVSKQISELKKKAVDYLTNETDRLKENLKATLKEVDNMVRNKMADLKSVKLKNDQTIKEIEEKEQKRLFLLDIKNRVDQIIEF